MCKYFIECAKTFLKDETLQANIDFRIVTKGDNVYFLECEKKNIYGLSEEVWCECKDQVNENIEKSKKLKRLQEHELYPILHFLAQNYVPPITDEEMAAQLPF